MTFGHPSTLMDWLHVDNLITAMRLAARELGRQGGGRAAGQVGRGCPGCMLGGWVRTSSLGEGRGGEMSGCKGEEVARAGRCIRDIKQYSGIIHAWQTSACMRNQVWKEHCHA